MPPVVFAGTDPSAHNSALMEALAVYETEKRLQLEQTKNIFEQSKAYQAVVIGLAYGGFFAIWSSAKSFTADARLMTIAASLMVISIIAYTQFMIVNMYILSKAVVRSVQISQTYGSPKSVEEFNRSVEEIANRREATNADLRNITLRVAKIWPSFFWTSVVSGMLGALLMLAVLIKNGVFG